MSYFGCLKPTPVTHTAFIQTLSKLPSHVCLYLPSSNQKSEREPPTEHLLEHPKLEGTHKDPHRTTQDSNSMFESIVQTFLKSTVF